MAARHTWEHVAGLFRKALAGGGERLSASAVRWKVHGDCEDPFVKEWVGTPAPLDGGKYWTWTPERRSTLRVEMWLRCNRCENCRKATARLWSHRISYEVANAPRSWFGTLTLNPASHFKCEVAARKDGVTPLHVSGLEVTRYLKRLRHHAKAPIRFVCVTELHKSGLPHYHLLIHEQQRGALSHAVLAEHWTWGFERWRVVDPQSQPAWYLCKYLVKQKVDRVRASLLYGGRQKDQPATSGDNGMS